MLSPDWLSGEFSQPIISIFHKFTNLDEVHMDNIYFRRLGLLKCNVKVMKLNTCWLRGAGVRCEALSQLSMVNPRRPSIARIQYKFKKMI